MVLLALSAPFFFMLDRLEHVRIIDGFVGVVLQGKYFCTPILPSNAKFVMLFVMIIWVISYAVFILLTRSTWA